MHRGSKPILAQNKELSEPYQVHQQAAEAYRFPFVTRQAGRQAGRQTVSVVSSEERDICRRATIWIDGA